MIVFPNAKVNIGLHIVSRRTDGYHNLETIFYPVKLTDALEMAETGKTGITFSGLHIDGSPQENLVMKAYHILHSEYGLPPVQFHLHKVIPSGAGLGGGSSDGAFTLKMLNDYYKLNLSSEKLREYAVRLGADCAFFLENKPALGTGIGNVLENIDLNLSEFEIVIVKPNVSVSTIQAYKNIIPTEPDYKLSQLPSLKVVDWKNQVKNDFEKSIFPQFPEVARMKNMLYEAGALYASMSGSGSAVFGIFEQRPSELEKMLPKGVFISR